MGGWVHLVSYHRNHASSNSFGVMRRSTLAAAAPTLAHAQTERAAPRARMNHAAQRPRSCERTQLRHQPGRLEKTAAAARTPAGRQLARQRERWPHLPLNYQTRSRGSRDSVLVVAGHGGKMFFSGRFCPLPSTVCVY